MDHLTACQIILAVYIIHFVVLERSPTILIFIDRGLLLYILASINKLKDESIDVVCLIRGFLTLSKKTQALKNTSVQKTQGIFMPKLNELVVVVAK